MISINAIYSTLNNQELLNLVIERYSLSMQLQITYIKRGFNDTYLLSDSYGKYILRVYKHNWKSRENVEAEIQLLNYLKENEISVSFPIKDNKNEFVQIINAPEGIRYAVLFTYAEGKQIKKLNAEQANILGVETGKIHNLTHNKNVNNLPFAYTIENLFTDVIKTLKPLLINNPEHLQIIYNLNKNFTSIWENTNINELGFGICHGDLQCENFHFTNENEITFFDFDFLGSGYLIYDIGVFIWYDHKNKTKDIIAEFIKGYKSQRQLTSSEIKLIPYFSTLRALFQMNLFLKISDGNHLPLWPLEQVVSFIEKINRWQETELPKVYRATE